ncbi:MAG: RNA polymerase sigma factor [Cytophagales bacterium]|nr:MAG: RNA polymerase sigma factor [Cytophagales bacterium]TAF59889.1 MAG: RNA polymerase sigma factor [Cytophagales bacterium]
MSTAEFNVSLQNALSVLRPFAVRLTKGTDSADDLLQDTMLKAFSNRERFLEGTNIKAWLYTIMKNTFITNYQRMIRRNTIVDSTDNAYYINTSSDTLTQNEAVSSFVSEDINKALYGIDEVYRTPFIMYYRGFKYHEISERLRLPIGTVKNRIHIARKDLKEKLAAYSN